MPVRFRPRAPFCVLAIGPATRLESSLIHFWSVRLSVRTQAFHACKRGSIPLRSTKFFRRVADVLRILKQPSRVGVLELVHGDVGKLVTPADCKSAAPGIVGSTPTVSTSFGLKVFMDARQPVTLKEGDRYPLGPPINGSVAEPGLLQQS